MPPVSHFLQGQLARRLGLIAVSTNTVTAEQGERRRPTFRCAGCNAPGKRFVFMSNGGDCCLACARGLAAAYGHRPVGMRADDIVTLD